MRSTLRFLLNGAPVELSGVDPRRTLLDWLREDRRLTGTKEGCNEGDCGACTVVVTRTEDGRHARRAVNACITLLPMVEGAEVRTVDAVAAPDGRLHPAQAAIADLHGSQCGFCTPGFVMSLWAAWPDGPGATPAADLLGGNLCRCTGYGALMEAATAMHDLPPPDWETAPDLAALGPPEPVRLEGGGATAFLPTTEDELAALALDHPDAVLVAGATDVGLWLTKGLREPRTLIFTNRVAGFAEATETEAGLEIGAGARWADLSAPFARLAPDLGEIVRRFAGPQTRNAGTLGGNVANGSPIGDGPPALIALGAELELRRGSERRTLPLEAFFLDYGRQDRRPGEIVSRLRVPRPDGTFRAWKISKRFDDDISAVCGATLIRVEDGRVTGARIAFGGMAATPRRARSAEAALEGAPWSRATVEAAAAALAEDFAPIDDHRAGATYRMRTARALLLKAWLESEAGGLTPADLRLVGPGAAA